MNKLILTILTLGLFSSSFAQQPAGRPENTSVAKEVIISGNVKDKETNEPLEYATIAFFSKQENKIITGGITDTKGDFSIPVPAGIYDVSIEYISFKKITIPNKNLTEDQNIGNFLLDLDMEALDAVEVIAERTTVEIKLDKKIYNVGKDLTVRGGTVSDVLDNVPSVSVDVEGNVQLRGSDDVTILINGKPSGLVGLNSTDALRQLPAEAIERVEVITSPSARYDAEGSAGILNIILRRSKLQGLNGAISANVGHPTSAGASGNINFRTGDFNFFNTTGYSYREVPGKSTTKTEYYNGDDPSTFLNEYREFERVRKGLTTNTGVEWYITDAASLTTSVVYRESDNDNTTTNTIEELNSNDDIVNRTLRLDPEFEKDKLFQYVLNYDVQLNGNSQHRLTADFQIENNKEDERSIINENGEDIERVGTTENQDRILLQADYTEPLNENSQWELGYRGSFNNLDTDYLFEENKNGDFVKNDSISNNLFYKEYVNAFYSQYGTKFKEKFSVLLGLRLESTRITIDQKTSGDFSKKNYTDLFPTVNLGYNINEKQSITLGYNRRIRRPRSRFINPFPSRSSATNIFQGNPDIDPSYSNGLDFGYLNRFGKLTLNSSVYYRRSTDIFTFISEDTGETVDVGGTPVPVIRRYPINLASNDRYGFEFTVTYRPSKKWNINGNFNVFQSVTRGDYNDINYDAENVSWFIRLNNKYTLPGEIDWQTRMFYRGPREDAISKSNGMFSLDFAFSKDLFNEDASIAFNISDVFNSRKRQSVTTQPTFQSDSEFQWRQRTFNLSFTYRFNQQKKRQRQGQGNGGGDDFEFEGKP